MYKKCQLQKILEELAHGLVVETIGAIEYYTLQDRKQGK